MARSGRSASDAAGVSPDIWCWAIYVQSLGLPVWLPPLMGTVVYGGSLEFVLASLLLGGFAPVSAFLMALMIQARHLFYGLTMLQRYRGYGLRSA